MGFIPRMGRHKGAPLLAAKELLRPYPRWLFYRLFPGRRPHYFLDCWKHPCYALSRSALEAASLPQGTPPDVLFFPMTDWHTRIQRTQQLAKAFAALGHRCFCVNPHLGCEYLRPYLADPDSRLSVLEERIFELHIHLPREHVFHSRLLAAAETERIVAVMEELAHALQMQRAVQIVSLPIWLEAAVALRDRYGFPIAYDCCDFLGGFRNIASEIVSKEAAVFEAADLVVFSSQPLMETAVADRPDLHKKILLARNAVDVQHFAGQTGTEGRSRKGAVVVGYAGALDHWFDVEAVEAAVRTYTSFIFLLIGRVEDQRIRKLEAYPNVEFIGEVPHVEVPGHLNRCHLAMIPFLRNSLTMHASPIKLYEYFSLGLPVVAVRIPEVEQYGDLVYLASGPEEFAAQIGKAAEEKDPSVRRRRMQVAERESWVSRASQLLRALGTPTVIAAPAGR